jgi:formylglycine-generating enzyme
MKTPHLTIAVPCLLLASFAGRSAWADVLNMGGTRNADGSWTGLASLETVAVGSPGNAGDTRYSTAWVPSFGSVSHTYKVGKYEVTAGQYTEFLSKVAGVDTYGLYNPKMWSSVYGCKIERFAGSGTTADPYQYRVASDCANRPVNYVSFWDGCRFANWLHSGQLSGVQGNSTTEDGAYTLTAQGMTNNTVSRNGNWKWAVPSEDEWYKAAYYDPVTSSYYDYPTSSNSVPGNVLNSSGTNNANFYASRYTVGSPYWRTEVGVFAASPGPYGTFDQGGNVREWNEAVIGTNRGLRGGSFNDRDVFLLAWGRFGNGPDEESVQAGFRVVQVPEPTTLALLALGGLLIARRRRA